ncbi:MAG: ABC transporter substrate-binding protein [Vulcanimicrobiaceae bacterium]
MAACVLAACTKVGPAASAARHPWTVPGVLRIGSAQEPDSLNPMFGNDDAVDQVDAFLFAPLFRYGPRGELIPELASAVPSYRNGGISRDGKTIVLHLRPGLRWSDGAPLDARDLRFTWQAVTNPRNDVKSSAGWDEISAIELPDRVTAVVHLKAPDASILGIFATGGAAYPPLPAHLLATLPDINHAPFNADPISSGPFLLRAWHHGSSLEFSANPRYWRGPPKLRAISFRIVPNPDTLLSELATHEIDLVASVPIAQLYRLQSVAGIRVVRHLVANFRRLDLNTASPLLRDVRVRLAIAEGIDWKRMRATVYHRLEAPATSDIPPGSWADPHLPPYPYDAAQPAQLLTAAGWLPGPGGIRVRDGKPLRLEVSATPIQENEAAELQMQADLRRIGIDLEIKNYPSSFLFAEGGPLYGGKYDLEWSIDTEAPDPDNRGSWSDRAIPPHGANTTFLRDATVTHLADEAVRTYDRARRAALYRAEETRLHALVPAVYFYWETVVAAYNDDLDGYRPAEYITDNWNSWQWSI